MLAGWQPPLTLGFRKTPTLSGITILYGRLCKLSQTYSRLYVQWCFADQTGWLNKQSQLPSSKTGKHKWRRRYFSLANGHLQYFETDDTKEDVTGDIKLMGCAVSLVRFSEINKPFGFCLHSGLEILTLKAESKEEMMRWATMLYHAVAIANGGGYLLVKERMKLEVEKVTSASSSSQQSHGIAQAQSKTLEQMLQKVQDDQLQGPRLLALSPNEDLQHGHHEGGEDEQEEEGEEDEEEEEVAAFKPVRKAVPNSLVDVNEDPSPPLSDEHIAFAFSSLRMGDRGAEHTMLRPIHFCHFIRIVTGKQNLFYEMDTFHKRFDVENNGFVYLHEFQQGVHRLEAKDPKHAVIVGLKAFVRHSLISL